MDPLSIVGTAVSLAVAIGRVAHEVDQFTRQLREARRELNDISRELGSLKSAIELLSEDLETPGVVVPGSLADIFQECQDSITRLEATIQKYAQDKRTKRIGYVWSGKETIMMHKGTLSAHRAALDLAVDVITLSLSREIKTGVDETLENTKEIKASIDETKANTNHILDQIAALQARLPETLRSQREILGSGSTFILQKYLDELTDYTESVIGGDDDVTNAQGPRVSMIMPKSRVSSPVSSTHSWGDDLETLHATAEPEISAEERHYDLNPDTRQLPIFTQRASFTTSHSIPSKQESEAFLSQAPVRSDSREKIALLEIGTDRGRSARRCRSVSQLSSERNTQPRPTSSSVTRDHDQTVDEGNKGKRRPTTSRLLKSVAKDFLMLHKREVSGLETLSRKEWRRLRLRAMKKVPKEDIAPENGKSYERGSDYEVDTSLDGPLSPRIYPIGRAGRAAEENPTLLHLWVRALTMQDPLVCNTVSMSHQDARTSLPLALAIVSHDWDWLDHLLAADEQRSGARAWIYWRGRDSGVKLNILEIALDWNVALADRLLEWWIEVDAETANEARYQALLYILRGADHDKLIAPEHVDALADLRLHALELFLTHWPVYLLNKRVLLVRKAIARSDARMLDVLLQFARQSPYGDLDAVEALQDAIFQRNWQMVRHLAERGAGIEDRILIRVRQDDEERYRGREMSAVNLANVLGCFDEFKEAVGDRFIVKGNMLDNSSSAAQRDGDIVEMMEPEVRESHRKARKSVMSKFSMLFSRQAS